MVPTLRWTGLMLLAGCSMTDPSPFAPSAAVAFTPPPAFELWWTATEQCSELRGSFDQVQWYVVPNVETFDGGAGTPVVGVWSAVDGAIRITVAGAYQNSELVIRHEMLHALLGQKGHPDMFFGDRCGLTWDRWQQG